MRISTRSFQAGAAIPQKYTCSGEDISPELTWTDIPSGTKALVLIVDDPDAPSGLWTHWLLYDLPPSTTTLPENFPRDRDLPGGGHQGTNDFGKIGYSGPCPPPGKPHRYFFRLYALNAPLGIAAGATRAQLDAALKSAKVLAESELMGTFRR